MSGAGRPSEIVDARAVRVAVTPTSAAVGLAAIVLQPGGPPGGPGGGPLGLPLVDGEPARLRLERRDPIHAVLVDERGTETQRIAVAMLPVAPPVARGSGIVRREVIVDGWRIEVELESEMRAVLLERATQGREATMRSGRTELRAVIPGRIVAVMIAPGDPVVAGQQVMVVEAMKMQNELRAPRDGVVGRVEVGSGQTVDVGDLLLVLQ